MSEDLILGLAECVRAVGLSALLATTMVHMGPVVEGIARAAPDTRVFVGGAPKTNRFRRLRDLPAKTPEAEALSKDLKKRGFRFVGPTICYAFMQAVGMVNDHTVDCFRHREVARLAGSAGGRRK